MMPFTKCPVCGGEIVEKEVEKLLRGGVHVAVVRVCAEVCLHCGELSDSFWTYLDTIVQSAELVIDRPRGTPHPRYPSCIYPLDYGYLAGTSGGDGQGVDVWRGSLPERQLDAVVCTVDILKRDVEVKLLLGCTAEEKRTVCDFHNEGAYMAAILVERVGAC